MLSEPESTPRRLQKVEQERIDSLHQRIKLIREWTQLFQEAASYVEERWFDLDSDYQDAAFKVDRSSAYDRETALEGLFRASAEGLLHENEVRVCLVDISKYRAALHSFHASMVAVLEEERRRLAVAEASIAEDPDALAEIAAGEQEFSAHLGTRYTQEEFLKRFSST
jgi:hypothetical protein